MSLSRGSLIFTIIATGLLLAPATSWSTTPKATGSSQIQTEGPDLVSVKILSADLSDTAEEIVTYCFDAELGSEAATASAFTLVDFNGTVTLAASSATVEVSTPTCVNAKFASGVNVAQYSIGAIADSAIKDARGFASIQGSAPLEGSALINRWGDTTQPQLVAATPHPEDSTVSYFFDEELNPTITHSETILGLIANPLVAPSPAPSKFAFFDSQGGKATATDVVSIDGNEVVVTFGSSVAPAVRFSVDADAVADRQKASPGGQKNPPGAIGGATGFPDLAKAQFVPGTKQIDFDFDELVTEPVATSFLAYARDGSQFQAQKVTARENGRVRASFAITDFRDKIVAVAVGAGAVKAGDGGGSSLVGSAGIRNSRARPGFTAGPDLELVEIDEENVMGTFHFDRALAHTTTDPALFKIVDLKGGVAGGTEILGWGDDYVTVSFVGATIEIKDAVGGSVNPGAVADLQGNKSPVATLQAGYRVKAAPFVPGGPPSPTPTATESPRPTPTPSGSTSPSATPTPSATPNNSRSGSRVDGFVRKEDPR